MSLLFLYIWKCINAFVFVDFDEYNYDESFHSSLSIIRRLEEEDVPPIDTTSTPPDSPQSDSNVLRTTFMVYGSILLVGFLLFCDVRRRFPRPYTLRQWIEEIKVRISYSLIINFFFSDTRTFLNNYVV